MPVAGPPKNLLSEQRMYGAIFWSLSVERWRRIKSCRRRV
jgi:hypothetical protein